MTSRAPHPVVPNSPPPSFRSRPGSPTPEANAALADSFDSPSDDDDDDDDADMRNHRSSSNANFSRESEPLVAASAAAAVAWPSYARSPTAAAASSGTTPTTAAAAAAAPPPPLPSGPTIGGGQTDGVFANLSAKPSVGEKLEEHPPVCMPRPHVGVITMARGFAELMECAPRHTNKLLPMLHRPTGKQPSWLPAWLPMKSLLTGCRLAPSLHSSGMR